MYSLSTTAFTQANYELAAKSGQECLQIYLELEDVEGLGQAYIILGNLEYAKGNYVTARSYYLKSLEPLREAGQKRLIAYTLNNLGIIAALLEQYELGPAYFNECVTLARELGDKQGELYGLINIVEMSLLQKDLKVAGENAQESIKLARLMAEKDLLAISLELLGWISIEEGEHFKAQTAFLEALQLRRELDNRKEFSKLFSGLSKLAWDANQVKQAVTLVGFIAATIADADFAQPLKRYEQTIFDEITSKGRSRLGHNEFEEVFKAGKQLSFEEAISFYQLSVVVQLEP